MSVEVTVQADTVRERSQVAREHTPIRKRVRNWKVVNACRRCGQWTATDGEYYVHIYGKGWWHDACFRIVRPEFYVGLPEDAS